MGCNIPYIQISQLIDNSGLTHAALDWNQLKPNTEPNGTARYRTGSLFARH